MAKKDTYIEYELEFLEKKANELKRYVENRPFDELVDRINWKTTKTGSAMPLVIASIEAQQKALTQALKDYAEIIQIIDKLREKEEIKKSQVRGDQDLSPLEGGEL